MLLLFGLLDKLHSAFKDNRPYHPPAPSAGTTDAGTTATGEEWVGVMRERLMRHDQHVLKELVQVMMHGTIYPALAPWDPMPCQPPGIHTL